MIAGTRARVGAAVLSCGVASCVLGFSLSLLLSGIGSVPAPTLDFAPAQGGEDSAGEDSGGSYEEALAAVEETNIAVNSDPEANLTALSEAIEQLSGFGPQIAASPDGRETLDLSLLNLARTLLLTEDEARAAEVMDQVIRSAYGRTLPTRRFGPTLVEFHDQRRALLDAQGSASIQVQCRVSCRVVIDAQATTTDSGPLYLGSHRVWIEAVDHDPGADAGSDAEPARHEVVLEQAGTTTVLHFPAEEPVCDEPAPVVVKPAPPPEPKRMLPRWAEITVAVIGVGATIAGGVMLGLDGNCSGGGGLDPIADAQQCPQLYEGTVPGLVAIGVGSALVVAGAVTLSVDEVRVGNQRGRQALLTWKMRF